jgi:hypothetical protein
MRVLVILDLPLRSWLLGFDLLLLAVVLRSPLQVVSLPQLPVLLLTVFSFCTSLIFSRTGPLRTVDPFITLLRCIHRSPNTVCIILHDRIAGYISPTYHSGNDQ